MAKITRATLPDKFFDTLSWAIFMRPLPPPMFQKKATTDSSAESYCTSTGLPLHECRCWLCDGIPQETFPPSDTPDTPTEEPITWPSILVAAPVEPVLCVEEYYGMKCKCPVPHEIRRRRW
jgi:hypothetical protein